MFKKGATSNHPAAPRQRTKQKESPELATRKPDLRIRRTCERLGSALIELIQERPIDTFTVQNVLDRASVGRSTFYLHYRDKDDLLFSQLEEFLTIFSTWLAVRKEKSNRVVAVAEMFEHIGSARKLYRALADSDRLNEFFDLAQTYFARSIALRIKESRRVPGLRPGESSARSAALAGSLLSLLRWWLDAGAKESPQAMDDLFHQIVWSGFREP